MKIEIYPTAAAAEQAVVSKILAQVAQNPQSVLGLATGGTMEAVYGGLISAHERTGTSFAGCASFNLDEYLDLSANDPNSYRSYMESKFFDHVDLPRDRCYLPDVGPDPEASAARYENLIREVGPVDLQLLGIGGNGHIGFNEPLTPFSTTTHVTDLSPKTIEANARYFVHKNEVPRRAITMGIATILSARSVVLLATGRQKASAILAAIKGPKTERCPASALQGHESVTFVLDSLAGSALEDVSLYAIS